MTEHDYIHYYRTDNDLCIPVIPPELMDIILASVESIVVKLLGEGPRPRVIYDLEQVQVVNYGAFERVTDGQRAHFKKLHEEAPIRPEEMVFLALRPLFGFAWHRPKSEADIQRAAAYELALNKVLTSAALDFSADFQEADALLPYWGRLSFIRVMSAIPPESITKYRLNEIACVLVKRQKFNATTFALEQPVIGLNYALEPILKNLNRYLLHYFHSQDLAGPARMSRAWEGIVPTVLHFWSDVDVEAQKMAHALTADQIDFILMHEIGHVAMDHPKRLRAVRAAAQDVTPIRHEFEFCADAFALGLMRSRMINQLRHGLSAAAKLDETAANGAAGLDTLREYQTAYGAAYLLFIYMDFIDRAGRLIKRRLGESVPLRKEMDSHPSPTARFERLQLANLGDLPYTSELVRYGRSRGWRHPVRSSRLATQYTGAGRRRRL